MIQYNPKSWFSLIFDVYSQYVIRQLMPLILFSGLSSAVFAFLVLDVFELEFEGNVAFHSILGVILGLFLVIRTNTAYDRWWEGRQLWGKLVNDARHLAIKFNNFLPKESIDDRRFFLKMIPNICFSMKEHLRDSRLVGELDLTNPEVKDRIIESKHRPNIINDMIYERVMKAHKEGHISDHELFLVDKELKGFIDVIGACERIKNTPIPYSYSMFIKKFLFIYSITLPVSFVWVFGYWTTPLVMLAFYFLMSVELISEEIEDPFGKDVNDLPLDDLCVKIKKNVSEILKTK
ncbi:MAG: hypothetical protein GY816_08370 [Cytophagales bacterium]|nr:hypothetical protein [Cytophagales bacterium]